MSAVVIVVVQPAGEFGQAVGLAGVGPCVGPLGDQGPVEPLDLAVGLGRVGPGVLVRDAGVLECLVEGFGPVAGAVVGQDPLDGDALAGEPGLGPGPEPGGGVLALIAEDLDVGQAGVVVDGVVDVVIPTPAGGSATVAYSLGASDHAVAAAVGDPAQLLDVDVDQRTGGVMFVADGCGLGA